MRKKIANHVFQKVQYPEYINKSYNTTKTQSNLEMSKEFELIFFPKKNTKMANKHL